MLAGHTRRQEARAQRLAAADHVHRFEPGPRFLDVAVVGLLVDAGHQPRGQLGLGGVVGVQDRADGRVFGGLCVLAQHDVAAVVDADLAQAGVVAQVEAAAGRNDAADLHFRARSRFGRRARELCHFHGNDVGSHLLGHFRVVDAHAPPQFGDGDAGVTDTVEVQGALLGHDQAVLGVASELARGDGLGLEETFDLGRGGAFFHSWVPSERKNCRETMTSSVFVAARQILGPAFLR
jgi:hypothetical protein